MKHTFTLLRNSTWLWCIFFLLNGCTSPGKKTPEVHVVEIKQMKFQPAELTVQKGDTIVWINRDMVPHNVTEEKTNAWTSGPLLPGKSWSMPVTKSADYYCSIHVVMKGRLMVQ